MSIPTFPQIQMKPLQCHNRVLQIWNPAIHAIPFPIATILDVDRAADITPSIGHSETSSAMNCSISDGKYQRHLQQRLPDRIVQLESKVTAKLF
jgi:hypothetical protein